MHDGRFAATLSKEEASQEKVLEYASGLGKKNLIRNGSEGI
jgi:hypothetical protein